MRGLGKESDRVRAVSDLDGLAADTTPEQPRDEAADEAPPSGVADPVGAGENPDGLRVDTDAAGLAAEATPEEPREHAAEVNVTSFKRCWTNGCGNCGGKLRNRVCSITRGAGTYVTAMAVLATSLPWGKRGRHNEKLLWRRASL